jgi:hypothetical protein
MTPALAQTASGWVSWVCAWRGRSRIDEAAREADFLESCQILDGKACLYTCGSAALVNGNDICRGD